MKKLILLLVLVFAPATAIAQPDTAARECCTKAMNADPEFAKAIVLTADKQIDQKTIDSHKRAQDDIAENKLHVILAYAAMWIIAAGFVVFLWMRQQALRAEIAQLRKELDAKGKDA